MDRIIAEQMEVPPEKGELPSLLDWEGVEPVAFCYDWRGENEDPQRETRVQLLWSPDYLFMRFLCRYKNLYVFEDSNSRRDKLWLRDVAEVFIQPGEADPVRYKEFEISPNGDWLDLDIHERRRSILFCDLASRVVVNPDAHIWTAEMGIPIKCMTAAFDPDGIWRLNFFRIEGPEPNRFYSAWQPTFTPKPDFHVPEFFGELRFHR